MSYPFSLRKRTSIPINSNNSSTDSAIDIFISELEKLEGIQYVVEENKIVISKCFAFSSTGSNLKDLNKGTVTFEKNNGFLNIDCKIMLIEHLVGWIPLVILMAYEIINNIKFNILYAILIVSIANFVFCYLFPLITFRMFFNKTIKIIIEKCQ